MGNGESQPLTDAELVGLMEDGTVRLRGDPSEVEVLSVHRCKDCNHRHIGNGRCATEVARLCACCPQTWPSVSRIVAAMAANTEHA